MNSPRMEANSTFDAQKSIAALSFLIEATKADLYSVMKMLYLADRNHLGEFGRSITGDEYTAMAKGPLPERSYNLCKFVRGSRNHFDPLPNAREFLSLVDNKFAILQKPDYSVLSRSDIGALEQIAELFRKFGFPGIWRESHDAAWAKAWTRAQELKLGSIEMPLEEIASTLANGDELIEYLGDRHPGEAVLG